jgi:hypothetical protein
MTEQQPPPWEADSLSKYFSDAEYNERVTAINYPDIYDLVRRLQRAFERAEETKERNVGLNRFLIARWLLARAHSAVLASVRLSMSGQSLEAHCVLRLAIEQAWYAVHIRDDVARAEVWRRRNDSEQSKAKCKSEFTVAKVRASHEALDAAGAAHLQRLYEALIDFGAHPNQLGVFNSMHRVEMTDRINHLVGILIPDEWIVMEGVRCATAVGAGILGIYRVIFPERPALVGLDQEIAFFADAVDRQFQQFAPSTRPS